MVLYKAPFCDRSCMWLQHSRVEQGWAVGQIFCCPAFCAAIDTSAKCAQIATILAYYHFILTLLWCKWLCRAMENQVQCIYRRNNLFLMHRLQHPKEWCILLPLTPLLFGQPAAYTGEKGGRHTYLLYSHPHQKGSSPCTPVNTKTAVVTDTWIGHTGGNKRKRCEDSCFSLHICIKVNLNVLHSYTFSGYN